MTDINKLLMVEKGKRWVICHYIYQCAEDNNKYSKDYNKKRKLPPIQYWDINNLYGGEVLQNVPVDNFEWVKNASQFNEDFIKGYNGESDEEYFLEIGI